MSQPAAPEQEQPAERCMRMCGSALFPHLQQPSRLALRAACRAGRDAVDANTKKLEVTYYTPIPSAHAEPDSMQPMPAASFYARLHGVRELRAAAMPLHQLTGLPPSLAKLCVWHNLGADPNACMEASEQLQRSLCRGVALLPGVASTLHTLELTRCTFSDKGAAALAAALSQLRCLRHLRVWEVEVKEGVWEVEVKERVWEVVVKEGAGVATEGAAGPDVDLAGAGRLARGGSDGGVGGAGAGLGAAGAGATGSGAGAGHSAAGEAEQPGTREAGTGQAGAGAGAGQPGAGAGQSGTGDATDGGVSVGAGEVVRRRARPYDTFLPALPSLPQLQRLDLGTTWGAGAQHWGPDAACALAPALAALTRLTALQLACLALRCEGAAALAPALRALSPTLVELNLFADNIGRDRLNGRPEGSEAFDDFAGALAGLTGLRSLNLGANDIGETPGSAAVLAALSGLTGLTVRWIGGRGRGRAGEGGRREGRRGQRLGGSAGCAEWSNVTDGEAEDRE